MSNKYSYITFFRITIKAIYFVLVDNNAIIDYILKYQLIKLLYSIKIQSKVYFIKE